MGAGGFSIDTQYRYSYTTIVEKQPLVNPKRENRMSENSYPKFRVGAVQAGLVFMDREATVDKACRLIQEAGDNGARLVAFPEAFMPAYPYWSRYLPSIESVHCTKWVKENIGQNSKANALEIWSRLSKDQRNAILTNVFCHQCKLTSIKDYLIEKSGPDIVLRGKCSKCNGPVARLVENPNF